MLETYKLLYTPEAREGIFKLSADLRKIAERVLLRLSENPDSGKRLVGKLKGTYSIRVTRRYRVLYLVRHREKEIIVLDLRHRKDVYD